MVKGLLEDNNKVSSMRWALVQVIRMSYILTSSAAVHVIIKTIKGTEVDWGGIALLLGGLTAFIGASVTGKYFQKKVETKEEKNHEPE